MLRLSIVLALILSLWSLASVQAESTIHTVITTECGAYFTWQSMGMIFSHRKSGQPGPLTRIMSCTPEEWASLTPEQQTVMTTHVAPSYTHHPRTGDVYSAYNKPVAVIDWLARNDVKEDYVLIIDADMIMREPFLPDESGAKPGLAVSAYFGYMKGVNNKLAMKHVPEVLPRNDTLAGPYGRRGDQVGGFTLMNTKDLRRVAPLWLKFTEDVRADPDAWELTGDAYSKKPGDKPWISEMYGYSYACSKSDVWHTTPTGAMLYPGYDSLKPPKVLHYGLYWDIAGFDYDFDKHWHYGFDPFLCPPWNMSPDMNRKKVSGGLFPHPPRASLFKTKGNELLRDLLAIEPIVTLNQAFCERHRMKCLPSEELTRECDYVDKYAEELDVALKKIMANLPDPCKDLEPRCEKWAAEGECESNPGYMFNTCRKACKKCTPRKSPGSKTGEKEEMPGKKAPDLTDTEFEDAQLGTMDQGLDGDGATWEDSDGQDAGGDDGEDAADGTYEGEEDADGLGDASFERDNEGQVERDSDRADRRAAEEAAFAARNAAILESRRHNKGGIDGDQGDGSADNGLDLPRKGGRKGGRDVDLGSWKNSRRGGTGFNEEDRFFDSKDVNMDAPPLNLTDTWTEGGNGEGTKRSYLSELKLRCTRFPAWSTDQVKRCILLAEDGVAYDPTVDGGIRIKGSGEAVGAHAHRFVDRTHDVGRFLGEELAKVHLRENAGRARDAAEEAAKSLGIKGLLAWGALGVLLLGFAIRSRSVKRKGELPLGYQYGRHIFKYGRVPRED